MFARSPKVCTNKIRPGRAPGAASAYAPARSRAAKGNWKTLHDKQRWRDLAVSVMQVGYLSDLSYFMLAEVAKGLGLKDAAATYYKRALEAGKEHACGGEGFSCEGLEVQKLARAALGR